MCPGRHTTCTGSCLHPPHSGPPQRWPCLTRLCQFSRGTRVWLALSCKCLQVNYLDKLAQIEVIRYKVQDTQLPLSLVWLCYPRDLGGVLLSDELQRICSLFESRCLKVFSNRLPQGYRLAVLLPATAASLAFVGVLSACSFVHALRACNVCGGQEGIRPHLGL